MLFEKKEIKTEIYNKVVRPILFFGNEHRCTKNKNKCKVGVMGMRFLRRIENTTRIIRINKATIRNQFNTPGKNNQRRKTTELVELYTQNERQDNEENL